MARCERAAGDLLTATGPPLSVSCGRLLGYDELLIRSQAQGGLSRLGRLRRIWASWGAQRGGSVLVETSVRALFPRHEHSQPNPARVK